MERDWDGVRDWDMERLGDWDMEKRLGHGVRDWDMELETGTWS